jgi:lysophospholipase L1-like esterase
MYFVLLGDSIAVGQKISVHKTWVSSLSSAISDLVPGIVFQNASVNGNTTRLALERLGHDLLSLKPEYVMIQFGLNDSNYWETDLGEPRVSIEAYRANLHEILEKVHRLSPRQVFLNTNHPSLKKAYKHVKDKTHEDSSILYNDVVREVVQEYKNLPYNITLLDIHDDWQKFNVDSHRQLLLEDGVHLSTEGHKVYSSFVVPNVLNKLRQIENL